PPRGTRRSWWPTPSGSRKPRQERGCGHWRRMRLRVPLPSLRGSPEEVQPRCSGREAAGEAFSELGCPSPRRHRVLRLSSYRAVIAVQVQHSAGESCRGEDGGAVDSCRGEDGRRCGSPDPPGPAPAHPFTDPCISPARKYLLSTMYTTSVGREASRAPAMETP